MKDLANSVWINEDGYDVVVIGAGDRKSVV